MTYADPETQTVTKSQHKLEAWSVSTEWIDADGISRRDYHTILGTKSFANKFEREMWGYVDATYDSVPNTEGAYQLLTLKISYEGEVSYNHPSTDTYQIV